MKTLVLAMVMATLASSAALATDGAPGGPGEGTSCSGARGASTMGTSDSHRQTGDQKVRESGDGGGVTPDGSKPGVGSGSN